MSREFCLIVAESSYGVPATPVIGTNAFYMRLSADNAFSMQANPVIGKIPYGGGVSTNACAYSDSVTCTGTLQGELYAGAYSKFLLDWAITQVTLTGEDLDERTLPWVTTDVDYLMPPGDLCSVSIYHSYMLPDGTFKRKRYSGVKVVSGSITSSRQDPIFKFNFNLVGIRDDMNAAGTVADPNATEFPEPDDGDLPACNPWLFSHVSAGGLKIATTRTMYGSVNLAWTNQLAPNSWESKYVQLIRYCGRSSTLAVALRLKASPDDIASYKALTSMASELKLDNGSVTLAIGMPSSRWDTVVRDLKLGDEFMLNGTIAGYFNGTIQSDLVVTAGTHA